MTTAWWQQFQFSCEWADQI